jgi:lipid II:glycine glycyltransferase (peptidoglycan interpeptide bridge formation enzyme)
MAPWPGVGSVVEQNVHEEGSMPEQLTVEGRMTRGAAPSFPAVVEIGPDHATWDAFVVRSNPGSYLQTSAWAEVKALNGWTPLRFMGTAPRNGATPPAATPAGQAGERATEASDEDGPESAGCAATFGVQLLLRRPRPLPWAFAYAPRGPVLEVWNPATLDAFTGALRPVLERVGTRVSHVRIEPEIELNGPADVDGEFRHALRRCGWRPGTAIQPARTRQIDLRADEASLWGDLRKKWRQYVNKARRSEIRVVDAGAERLPEFYSIYRETAKRAGFIVRTFESYLQVWNAFSKPGMARLLMAEDQSGTGLATLFVLRVGNRVIEPYGGMTAAGAGSRANYLLKWEAIRTSRERGAVSYDMWGLSHEGIEHFKTGFGGREIDYVGAWDLVVDPLGRLVFDGGQSLQDRIGRWRHGIVKRRGSNEADPEASE